MAGDLYFLITPKDVGLKPVLFGREEIGFRIYAEDLEGERIWRHMVPQDHLDHILGHLAELVDENSTWQYNDTGEPVGAWTALVALSVFNPDAH